MLNNHVIISLKIGKNINKILIWLQLMISLNSLKKTNFFHKFYIEKVKKIKENLMKIWKKLFFNLEWGGLKNEIGWE